jgi:hypothetical protein
MNTKFQKSAGDEANGAVSRRSDPITKLKGGCHKIVMDRC